MEENKLTVHFKEAPPLFVHADKEIVRRILQNLVRNCIQHSNGDLEVSILAANKATVLFRNPVKSSTLLDVNRLFDRFYTEDQARSKSTGLGLSIVRLLAEQMGGRTSASLQDGALEIKVELPYAKS